MIRHFRTIALTTALLLAGCHPSPATKKAAPPPLATVPLVIDTHGGQRRLTVEVAASTAEQEHGLMKRTSLPANTGMVFPFPLPRMASFWMKDTLVPLDLLFVRPDGTIAAILSGKPRDLTPLAANEPVSAVVEIAGGGAATLGIMVGDHLRWGDCKGAPDRPGQMPEPMRFCPAAS